MSNVRRMLNDPFVRDVLVLLVAVLVGALGGVATLRRAPAGSLAWPSRVYLWLSDGRSGSRGLAAPSSHKVLSRREQLVLACFAWFFITFLIGALLFGCSYRVGCR